MPWSTLEDPTSALVIGARGGIGEAFVQSLSDAELVTRVYATSRDKAWCDAGDEREGVHRVDLDLTQEASLEGLVKRLKEAGESPSLILNCSGLLHEGELGPERTWRELDAAHLSKVFAVNAIGPALAIKHLVPLMPRKSPALFATLSARVGSIGDNRLGGWYGYRASKAAQNMIVKTASIEASHRYPRLIITALHPGTVASDLSAPFTKRLRAKHVVFSPLESAQHLEKVMSSLKPSDSGGFFAWDGAAIPW